MTDEDEIVPMQPWWGEFVWWPFERYGNWVWRLHARVFTWKTGRWRRGLIDRIPHTTLHALGSDVAAKWDT